MSTETLTLDTDIIIVGMGPTGLTLAHLLGRRGCRVTVLEREPAFYGNARAVYTDDECMRIFQAANMASELEADMNIDLPVQWVFKDGTVLAQFVRADRPNGWAASNFLYQPFLETRMEALLSRYPNIRVLRGREVTRLDQDENGVTVFHARNCGTDYGQITLEPVASQGDEQSLRARYVVGCDGGRSLVRSLLGIKLSGKSFPNPWLVVDIKALDDGECLRHLPYFNFYCDPECPTVSCPQPAGHHRFEFMLMPGQTREHMEDPATIRSLLAKHVDPAKVEILRKLVYTFNALVAERWRDRRVLMAGDAAHMTPQFMGQGMSSGIRDAYNLAWKLDAVVSGRLDDRVLDSYERERKPHAKEMIDISVAMKDFVSMANPLLALLRNAVVRIMLRLPYAGSYIREGRFKPPPTYAPGSYLGLPRRRRSGSEGRPIPQPLMRTSEGRRVMLDNVLGEQFAVIGFGVDPRIGLDARAIETLNNLGTRYLTVYDLGRRPQGNDDRLRSTLPALIEIEDLSGELDRWLRRSGARVGAVAVIRPDKFVFALVPVVELPGAVTELRHQLGLQPSAAPCPGAADRPSCEELLHAPS